MVYFIVFMLCVLVIILFFWQYDLQKKVDKLSEKIKQLTASESHEDATPAISFVKIIPETAKEIEKIIPASPKNRIPFFKNENWIGINLLNRIGALLIVIGAVVTATFEGFHPILRTAILFVFALGVVAAGEFLSRKKPTIFSLGVSATGVALIYVAIAASFFGLETINMYAAFFACALAAALGIFLATRHKAQVIGCFALIGGYLPIFGLASFIDDPRLIALIAYFILLSLFSLILAITRKWPIMNFIGLGLTISGTIFLGLIFQAPPIISLVYACFAFLLYTALPLISTHKTKKNFSQFDIWLVISNTFVSSIVIFLIAHRLEIDNLHSVLSLIFAAIYAGLAFLVKRAFVDKNMQMTFTIASIFFCVIFVPFFFQHQWIAIAWLAQAAVLGCYGILRNQKLPEFGGLSILGLASIWVFEALYEFRHFATLNYAFLTGASLTILACYLAKNRDKKGYGIACKIVTFSNLWLFLMYIILEYIYTHQSPHSYYLATTLVIISTFALAYIYAKFKTWADKSTKILAITLHSIGLFLLLSINALPHYSHLPILAQPAALLALNHLLNLSSPKMQKNPIKIIFISGYTLFAATQIMMVQGGMAFNNAIISLIYAAAAFAWIVAGLKLKNKPARKAGLFLAMASVAKLLVIDTWGLSTEMRIIAYISLGLILMLISFVYQKLNK